MRTLLRHMPSGLYFQGPDNWTSTPDKAFDFKTVNRALKFVEKTGLEQMEVAFAVDNPGITALPIEYMTATKRSSARVDPTLAALIACASRRVAA